MKLEFIKMEGAANDYVYIDALDGSIPELSSDQIRRIADRRRGVGGDGVVVIAPPADANNDARMIMWNADGSGSDMCGNALRCMANYIYERKQIQKADRSVRLESPVGTHPARYLKHTADGDDWLEVDMGPPRLEAGRIPVDLRAMAQAAEGPLDSNDLSQKVIENTLDVTGFAPQTVTLVSMGNPHCVIFVDDADAAPVHELGAALQAHPAFPEQVNVEFVSEDPDGRLYQRTYERGSGETLACGSGACAVAAAAVLTGRRERGTEIGLRLRGGPLAARWTDDDPQTGGSTIFLSGPARIVYSGSVEV